MISNNHSVPSSVLHPRLLRDGIIDGRMRHEEVNGVLMSCEHAAKDLLHVQLDNRNYLVPTSCRKFLAGHMGQWIAISKIRGKHYTRVMKGDPDRRGENSKVLPSGEDPLRARIAELEAENERLRADRGM